MIKTFVLLLLSLLKKINQWLLYSVLELGHLTPGTNKNVAPYISGVTGCAQCQRCFFLILKSAFIPTAPGVMILTCLPRSGTGYTISKLLNIVKLFFNFTMTFQLVRRVYFGSGVDLYTWYTSESIFIRKILFEFVAHLQELFRRIKILKWIK